MVDFSWKESIRPFFRDRKFLISHVNAEFARPLVEVLTELGAEPPFVLAGVANAGALEGLAVAGVAGLDCGPFTSVMDELRTTYAAFDRLPEDVRHQVDAWDPSKEARVLSLFHQVATPLGGRAHYGTRLPEWMVLDDKTLVDALWDELSIPHARSVVLDPARPDAIRNAWNGLASEQGVVIASDSSQGWHGGAERTRWAKTLADADAIACELAADADAVRVMPFLEGIPCGITGIVFPDRVVALRPAEMLVLRAGDRFVYTGTATVWRPSPPDVAAMRRLVKRVGVYLREATGYRGSFTVDGVLTVGGFLPTELNPRMGGATGRIETGLDVSLRMIDRVLIERESVDLRADLLERTVLQASSSPPVAMAFVPTEPSPSTPVEAWWDGTAIVDVEPDGPHGTVSWHASRGGGELRVSCDSELLGLGEPFAPVAVRVVHRFAETVGSDFGGFTAPRTVREAVSIESVAIAVRRLADAQIGTNETAILRRALDTSGYERLLALREALIRTRGAWLDLDDQETVAMARSAIAVGKVLGIEG